jgi:hypothetical protein
MPSKRSMMSLNGSSERRCKASSGGSSKQRISQSIELVGERDESPLPLLKSRGSILSSSSHNEF